MGTSLVIWTRSCADPPIHWALPAVGGVRACVRRGRLGTADLGGPAEHLCALAFLLRRLHLEGPGGQHQPGAGPNGGQSCGPWPRTRPLACGRCLGCRSCTVAGRGGPGPRRGAGAPGGLGPELSRLRNRTAGPRGPPPRPRQVPTSQDPLRGHHPPRSQLRPRPQRTGDPPQRGGGHRRSGPTLWDGAGLQPSLRPTVEQPGDDRSSPGPPRCRSDGRPPSARERSELGRSPQQPGRGAGAQRRPLSRRSGPASGAGP